MLQIATRLACTCGGAVRRVADWWYDQGMRRLVRVALAATWLAFGCGEDAAGVGGVAGGAGDGGSGGNRVFVTSTKFNGNFNGLTGADAQCQARADAAGLGGAWMAWLGNGVDGPATRFTHSAAPYPRMGGGV